MRATPLEPTTPKAAPTPAAPAAAPLRKGFAALTLLLLLCISYQALRPEPGSHSTLQHLDKLLHGAAFATLALTARLAAGTSGRALAAVVVSLLLYGAAIEVVQGFVPGRDASGWDLVADAVGIAAGLVLARVARQLPPLRSSG